MRPCWQPGGEVQPKAACERCFAAALCPPHRRMLFVSPSETRVYPMLLALRAAMRLLRCLAGAFSARGRLSDSASTRRARLGPRLTCALHRVVFMQVQNRGPPRSENGPPTRSKGALPMQIYAVSLCTRLAPGTSAQRRRILADEPLPLACGPEPDPVDGQPEL